MVHFQNKMKIYMSLIVSVVGDQCYPYTSGSTRRKGRCFLIDELTCDDGHVHKTTPPYRIANDERRIMKEIQANGPVQAIITVRYIHYSYNSFCYVWRISNRII